ARPGRPALGCDDGIEERLRTRLAGEGYSGIGGVAAWMGWPSSAAYAEREARYLAAEIAVLGEVLGELEAHRQRELVLDTTGSVIYAGNHLLLRLRKLMTVVHLAASPEEDKLLIEPYLTEPKPALRRAPFQPR